MNSDRSADKPGESEEHRTLGEGDGYEKRGEGDSLTSSFKLTDMSQHTYRILFTQEPEGGYTVNVPALPGCVTYGENIEHAIALAQEAVDLYLETLAATS